MSQAGRSSSKRSGKGKVADLARVDHRGRDAGPAQSRDQGALEPISWARLMHGRDDRLIEDALIAATALVHG